MNPRLRFGMYMLIHDILCNNILLIPLTIEKWKSSLNLFYSSLRVIDNIQIGIVRWNELDDRKKIPHFILLCKIFIQYFKFNLQWIFVIFSLHNLRKSRKKVTGFSSWLSNSDMFVIQDNFYFFLLLILKLFLLADVKSVWNSACSYHALTCICSCTGVQWQSSFPESRRPVVRVVLVTYSTLMIVEYQNLWPWISRIFHIGEYSCEFSSIYHYRDKLLPQFNDPQLKCRSAILVVKCRMLSQVHNEWRA